MLAILAEQKSKKKINERFVLINVNMVAFLMLLCFAKFSEIDFSFFRVSKVVKSVALIQREKFHR